MLTEGQLMALAQYVAELGDKDRAVQLYQLYEFIDKLKLGNYDNEKLNKRQLAKIAITISELDKEELEKIVYEIFVFISRYYDSRKRPFYVW